MLFSRNKIIINRFGGGGINKVWKETDETDKNSPPIKTCLKDNIVPFPGIKICWGFDNGRFTATLLHHRSLYSHCVGHVVLH